MTKLKDLKARFMEDAEFRAEYARADEDGSRPRCSALRFATANTAKQGAVRTHLRARGRPG